MPRQTGTKREQDTKIRGGCARDGAEEGAYDEQSMERGGQ